MLQSTLSDLSKKDFTTAVFHQALLLYRANLLDVDHIRELMAAEFPEATARVKHRSTRAPKRRTKRTRARQYKPDDLLTPEKAARVLGLSAKTLANFRSAGGGPLFIKLANRTIRYRHADLKAFIEQGVKQNTSQY
ncbi:helix-turn-helix transcriptional regulator [Cohaesibacter intestini]|uniref:helix-turn-helix transcriptional regulator n=1 Tax=Cohaesibacter intestini TaxID=2211145 RepID=UPI0018E521AE|nr:helix-turn-helix domain-containing protein [Cohaesibacter intestini]